MVKLGVTLLMIALYVVYFVAALLSTSKGGFFKTLSTKRFSTEGCFQFHTIFIVGLIFYFERFGATIQNSFGFLSCLVAIVISSKSNCFKNHKAASLQRTYLIIEAILFMLVFVRAIDRVNTQPLFFQVCLVLILLVVVASVLVFINAIRKGTIRTAVSTLGSNFQTNRILNPFVHLVHSDSRQQFQQFDAPN
ncbi:hypothetical protein GEMRC1_009308 [Eukaryota sp. GEM-RC1]